MCRAFWKTYVVVIFMQNSIDGRLRKLLWTFQNCYISSFSTYFIFFTSLGGAACAFFVADWQSKQRKPKLQNLRNFSLLKTQTKITSSTLFTKKFNKNCEVNSNFHKKNVKVLSLKSEKKIIENFLFDLISIFFRSFSRSSYIRSDPDFFKFVLSFAFIFITITNFSSKTTSKNNSFYKIKINSTNNWVLIKNDCKVEEWIWNRWKIYYDCM